MPLSIFSDIVPTFIVIIYDLFDLNVEFAWMREDLLGKYRTCDHQVSKQAGIALIMVSLLLLKRLKTIRTLGGSGYLSMPLSLLFLLL